MDFMSKFKPNENKIKEFENWIVVIREKQVTLGASVIILKRQTDSLSDLTGEEMAEFPIILKWYEETCKRCFGAEKFNYIVAMMKDNFVHYHAFPRYSKSFEKYGEVWQDIDWPKVVNFRNIEIERVVLNQVIQDMVK